MEREDKLKVESNNNSFEEFFVVEYTSTIRQKSVKFPSYEYL